MLGWVFDLILIEASQPPWTPWNPRCLTNTEALWDMHTLEVHTITQGLWLTFTVPDSH